MVDPVDEVPPCWSELVLGPGSWVEAGVVAAVGGGCAPSLGLHTHCHLMLTIKLPGRQDSKQHVGMQQPSVLQFPKLGSYHSQPQTLEKMQETTEFPFSAGNPPV